MSHLKSYFIVLIVSITTTVNAQDKVVVSAKTDSIYSWFVHEKFNAIHKEFDDEMSRSLNTEQLEATWGQIQMMFGSPIETKEKAIGKVKNLTLVRMPIVTDKSVLVLSVSFDSVYKVAGLFLSPGKINYTPPDYVNPEKFEERKLSFGGTNFPGNGILTLPQKGSNYPLVIIVPGSGPVDKDLSIGSNKIYKDLAWGLASNGIAVFRYDKRTHNHQALLLKNDSTIEAFTVESEYMQDLKEIIAQLKKRKDIYSHQIYILGHSQGGYLIPLIHQKIKGLAGYISLAGTLREIPELAIEQVHYLTTIDTANSDTSNLSDIQQKMLNSTSKYVLQMHSDKEIMPPYTLHYWQYLAKYKPQKIAPRIKQPMLILQGERDYQVTMKDFQIWKDCLGQKKNVSFQSYPMLNHLFMSGEGKSIPSEYMQVGNMSFDPVGTIINWLKQLQ